MLTDDEKDMVRELSTEIAKLSSELGRLSDLLALLVLDADEREGYFE